MVLWFYGSMVLWFYYITLVHFAQDFLGIFKIIYQNPSYARLSKFFSPVKLHWQQNGADKNHPIGSTDVYLVSAQQVAA